MNTCLIALLDKSRVVLRSAGSAEEARPILGRVEKGNDAHALGFDPVKDQILTISANRPKSNVSVPSSWVLDGPAHFGVLSEADGLRHDFFPHSRSRARILHGNEGLNAVQFGFRAPRKNDGELFQCFRLVKSCSAGVAGWVSARSSSKMHSRSARAALSK